MQRDDLRKEIFGPDNFKEIWLEHENGSKLCALISGDIGCLLYLRREGDAGYSSRNPDNVSTSEIEFQLLNGQVDTYPESWTYPLTALMAAMEDFLKNGHLPKGINWNNDSA